MQGQKRRVLPLLLFGSLCTHAVAAQEVTWKTCEGVVPQADGHALGERLRCGTLDVPFDHSRPEDKRTLALDVVLVRATAPSSATRTLLVQGQDRQLHLPASLVRTSETSGAGTHGMDELGKAFDIVALANRHDAWKPSSTCAKLDLAALDRVSTNPDDDDAWEHFKRYAHDCAVESQHLGTWQRAGDVEWLRRALGSEQLDILAGGPGAALTTAYAAAYPSTTGRILIDNGIHLDHGWDHQFIETAQSLERERHEQAYLPAAREHHRWNLGTTAQEVRDTVFRNVPMLFRTRWAGLLWEPADLRAAVDVARLYLTTENVTRDSMKDRVDQHRFMADDTDDARVRRTALALVDAFPAQGVWRSGSFRASFLPGLCNDLALQPDEEGVRQWLRIAQDQWLHWDQRTVAAMVVCSQWTPTTHPKPSAAALSELPPFVWMHYASHRTYPLAGAQPYLDELPNARLVVIDVAPAVASGKPNAYAFGPQEPCAQRIGVHYLLTGEAPSSGRTTCPAQSR